MGWVGGWVGGWYHLCEEEFFAGVDFAGHPALELDHFLLVDIPWVRGGWVGGWNEVL